MQANVSKIAQDALSIWNAGVAAVDADHACYRAIGWEPPYLLIDDQEYRLARDSRIILVGAGKAAEGMALGTLRALQESGLADRVEGWINMPGCEPTRSMLSGRFFMHPSRPLGSNLPTPEAVFGTQQILKLVRSARPHDVVLCLLSGGGSSLLVDPIEGLLLADKVSITQALSLAGANIHQLNMVRRALSQVKGGGLFRACNAEQLVTLVISDVLDDDLATIASGPTYASASTTPDAAIQTAIDVLGCEHPHTEKIRNVLQRRKESSQPRNDRTSCESTIHVLANNATAVDAAGTKAVELGYRYMMYCNRQSEGDADEVAVQSVSILQSLTEQSNVDCQIVGGEPTVNLQSLTESGRKPGRGGRNQRVVLSAARELMQRPDLFQGLQFCVLSGGTDGEDGSAGAAGAWIDHNVINQMAKLDHLVESAVELFDSASLFERLGSSIQCGLTGTNVCDLRVILVRK